MQKEKKCKNKFVFSCLTDERWSSAPPAALQLLRRTPRVGEVQQPTKEARRRIAVIITLRKCNKNSK
jgi:hypothetical protein